MRDLHRIKVRLHEGLKREIEYSEYKAIEYMQALGIIKIVEGIDAESPLLILRHDGHYERYVNLKDWNIRINTGFLRVGTNIDAYLDSLIEGRRVVMPKSSWELEAPAPVRVVVDLADATYDSYFDGRRGLYNLIEKNIEPMHPIKLN